MECKMSFFVKSVVLLALVKSQEFNFSSNNGSGTLLFVNVLFMHGDRTPIQFYLNDPFKNTSYWLDGLGHLTNRGKQQEYELGQWLRRRYDSLLAEKYSPDKLYVESTDYDRTLMSALSVLAGMYPPKESQIWNANLDWQPIPVHTTPKKYDKKFSLADCPAFKKEFENLLLSKEIEGLNKNFSDVLKILSNNSGQKFSSISQVPSFFSTVYIESLNNLSLPNWVSRIYPHRLQEASGYSIALNTWNNKLARLAVGLLVKDMISHMLHRVNKTKTHSVPDMWLYSADDTTIANLLNSLRVFHPHFPSYSSAVLMELRKDAEGKHFVKLLYRNSTNHEPYVLTLPGCSSDCPLDKFVELCNPIIPEDWDKECIEGSLLVVLTDEERTIEDSGVMDKQLYSLIRSAVDSNFFAIRDYRGNDIIELELIGYHEGLYGDSRWDLEDDCFYRTAAIQVLKYFKTYSVDVVISKPFRINFPGSVENNEMKAKNEV